MTTLEGITIAWLAVQGALYYQVVCTDVHDVTPSITLFTNAQPPGYPVAGLDPGLIPPGEWICQVSAVDGVGNVSMGDAALVVIPPEVCP